MPIMNAFCRVNSQNMTVEEIENHPEYNFIKEELICPNHEVTGCTAQLTFAKGTVRTSHLRLHIGDSHSENCEFFSPNSNNVSYIPSSEELSVTLTDTQLEERSKDHINDLLNPKPRGISTKPKPRKKLKQIRMEKFQ